MYYRRRGIKKYVVFIAIIWIIYYFIFASNENGEKLEVNQEMINILVARAKEYQKKHNGIEHEHFNDKNGLLLEDDHDHPIEEIKKAEEQNRDPVGMIQMNAPNLHDLNAPGNFILVSICYKIYSRFIINILP